MFILRGQPFDGVERVRADHSPSVDPPSSVSPPSHPPSSELLSSQLPSSNAGRPDLRLAGGALAGWVAVLWGLSRSSQAVAIGAAVACAAGLVFMRLGRGRGSFYTLAFIACAVATVLAPLSVRLHDARDSQLAHLAASRVEATAEVIVTSDPRSLAVHGPDGTSRVAVEAKLTAVEIAGHRTLISGAVLLLGPSDAWRQIAPGQRLRLDAGLSPPLPGNLLVATLSARSDLELLGAPPWWQRGASSIRAGLQRAARPLPELPRGLLPGLIDGDTSQLDPVLAARFKVAGLTHLTAVSGTNCSILVGAVAYVLRRFRASPRAIATIGGVVLVGFVIVARPSPSVLRAAVMAGIALAGLAAGRQRSAMPILAASVLLLLLWQPSLAADIGFSLSVAATAALLLVAPGWVSWLQEHRVPAGFAEPLAVAAAAHLVTAPIVVALSGTFSLVAIPANMLAEPVVAVTTVIGVLAALAAPVCLPVAMVLAEIAGWPCRWLVWVAETFGSMSGASVPWPSGVTGAALLIAVSTIVAILARRPNLRDLIAIAVVVALLVQLPVRSLVITWPPTGWLIVACDVGQGDALVISAGHQAAVVIDAGPDPVAVDRCLRELGVHSVPLLILSHSHLDHVGGIAGVLHDREVGRAVTSPLAEPANGHRLASDVLRRHGVALSSVSDGAELDVGSGKDLVRMEVLGPSHIFSGSRSDPNNTSLVIRAVTHGKTILLPGDAELDAQDDLLARGVDVRADILKVPHHGST
ncbi:ComEC/Rec2 family competence protein [Jatrophihabitans sp. DSM 45814]